MERYIDATFLLTPRICKAARALVDMSQADLAKASNVAVQTVADFERGAREPLPNNLLAMTLALATAGVQFIPENGGGAGVRLRKP